MKNRPLIELIVSNTIRRAELYFGRKFQIPLVHKFHSFCLKRNGNIITLCIKEIEDLESLQTNVEKLVCQMLIGATNSIIPKNGRSRKMKEEIDNLMVELKLINKKEIKLLTDKEFDDRILRRIEGNPVLESFAPKEQKRLDIF